MPIEEFKHSRAISPYFIPNKGGFADDFHGLTEAGGDPSVSKEDRYILGQADKCGTEKDIPEVTVPLTQYERGELDTYLTLANLTAKPAGGLTLTDFSAALVDVVYYVREEEVGTVEGSIWMPKTAIQSLSLSIDADEVIERSMELLGEDQRVLAGASNKYLIWRQNTAPSGTSGAYVITSAVLDPTPVVNPHVSGQFMLRVDRTRSGTTTTLTVTTDYTYDSGATELTIVSGLASDVYNIYYSAASFGSSGDPITVDSDSICNLKAENVTVTINDGTTTTEIDNITSISLDATLNRLNEPVVGSTDKIKEISDTPVTISITTRQKSDFLTEKAFMNTLAGSNLVSSVLSFNDNISVTIKIYSTNTKTTFLIGYKVTGLSYDDGTLDISANEFNSTDVTASSTNLLISDDISDL